MSTSVRAGESSPLAGQCPECHRVVILVRGRLRAHYATPRLGAARFAYDLPPRPICQGSHRRPVVDR